MAISDPVNGLILAGGHSSRMGKDKGLLIYHGKPQREFLFEMLMRACGNVFTSCRKEQLIPESLNPIVDVFDFPGPLNGILSAFHTSNKVAWLTVAIDMPFVDDAVISMLLRERDPSKLATCFLNPETGLAEPLLTIWEKESYPLLRKFSEDGNISPRAFLRNHDVRMIDPPDAKSLANFNSPDDRVNP